MNTQLQQLIEELTAEKEKAQAHADMNDEVRQLYMSSHFKGKSQAFSLCIEKLTKILNEGSVAAPTDTTKECFYCRPNGCFCGG